ncbi:MAG: efflux RND transporter permease subunit, partial [Planctomycetota bacterium]
MNRLLAFFVHRPILVSMVAATILVIGVLSLVRIPIDMMPEGMSRYQVMVGVPIQNMTPQEAEDQVYAPLEGQLLTIPGVKGVRGSVSANNVRLRVEVSPDIPIRQSMAEVRDRIQRARTVWPDFVDRWWTWSMSGESMPLFWMALGIPDQDQRWFDLVEYEVLPKLEAIEGVGEVSLFGMVGENVRLFFDQDRLRALGVNFREVLQALQRDNVSTSVGVVREVGTRMLVRAEGRFEDLDEIRDLPVGEAGLRIGDVARVERVRAFRDRVSRVDGKFTMSGQIQLAAGANAVATSQRVRAFFDRLGDDPRLAGVEPHFYFDKGQFIADNLGVLLDSAWQGGILALVVLLLFVRRLGTTVTVVLSLPLSLLLALTLHWFNGETLNLFSMAGLTLAIGMLVDNSIVVLENIHRLREKGLAWQAACIRGVQEVGTPVFLATLTTLAIWIPLLIFVDDPRTGVIVYNLAFPLCMALCGSLFVALVLLPSAIAWLNRGAASTARRAAGPGRIVGPMTAVQRRLVGVCLRAPFLSFVLLTALCIGGIVADASLSRPEPEERHGPSVEVRLDLPQGTTLADANRISRGYEDFLAPLKQPYKFDSVRSNFDRNQVELRLSMTRGTSLEDKDALVRHLEANLPESPGVETRIRSRGVEAQENEPQEDRRGFFLQLRGRDSETLRELGLTLGEKLVAAGLAEKVDRGTAMRQEELRLELDRGRMQELGVDPQVLQSFVSSGLSSRQVSRFQVAPGHEIPLVVEFDDREEMSRKDLEEMPIWSRDTGFQRLGDLAEFRFTKGFEEIRREDGVLSTYIGGSRAEDVDYMAFQAGARKAWDELQPPRGYKLEFGGGFREEQVFVRELARYAIPGLILIFLVMGLLFESLLL